MNNSVTIRKKSTLTGTPNDFPASKSISNRALILNALAGNQSTLHNLSQANDTQLMTRLVNSPETVIDVEDAGTTMRFLTAYFGLTNQLKVMTGTARMKERPIGILVEALRTLGVDISYLEKEGYPPLQINGFKQQRTDTLHIRGDVSSQFISALMMTASLLPEGLTLMLDGKVGSWPYIEMTAKLMKAFGINTQLYQDRVSVQHQCYHAGEVTVESDWSAASYWYAFVALAGEAEVWLPNLPLDSLQGDYVIVEIMHHLGVETKAVDNMLHLTRRSHKDKVSWDFTNCPDLAQTVCVVCAALGVEGDFTGMESLRIKETDRIHALQVELAKLGATLHDLAGSRWKLEPSKALPAHVQIDTYKDHRMAMAFAPLATRMDVIIENPSVVKKSYPRFWEDVRSFGFDVKLG